ncbi:radical SAM protein [Candidatus Bipolaricaulota bacterium]|nr:radical SAM protein [Candidatus Bipolaricaulota bacterium]
MSHLELSGPNQHPLLGSVLGVDFSPKKVCSYDCVYCGVGMNTTRKTMEREMFLPVSEVLDAIERHVNEHGIPDTFFLTGSGEPMLYAGFGEMAEGLKQRYSSAARTVYTNGSLLPDPQVRAEIALCDPIQANLDGADEAGFLRLARPHRETSLADRIEGYKALKAELDGQRLWLHGVFVKGVNDDPESLRHLGEALREIGPDLYIVRVSPRVIEGLCEPVEASFQTVVEDAWKDLEIPIRFALPRG